MFLSTVLSVLGLGVIVFVLFTLAVYALPFFVAMTVGLYVYESDAGVLAAIIAAFLSGAATLILGQIAFATVRSIPIRLASPGSTRSGDYPESVARVRTGRWPLAASAPWSSVSLPGCALRHCQDRKKRRLR